MVSKMTNKALAESRIHSALPDTISTFKVAGLRGEINIIRDGHGIPHIRAKNAHDAFFGQGFATAQDRLWQMEFDRRQAYGTWAELVGSAGVESDRLMRKFQIGGSVKMDYENLNLETRDMLESYSSGVNAFINATQNLPVEYSILGAEPKLWTEQDCLAVFKIRHIMMGVFEGKMWRAQLVNELGPKRAAELLKGYQQGHLLIVPPLAEYSEVIADSYQHLKEGFPYIEMLLESPDAGSNSWAIHGNRTKSGKPLLAGDPHRGLDVPNCYFQNQISCPDFDVIGLSFPGCPGFPHFGHNRNVAWSVTHAGADYQDLFIERFDGGDPLKYEWKDEKLDVELKPERIVVSGGDDEINVVKITKHGPIISESSDGSVGLAFMYTSTVEPNLGFQSLIPQMKATSVDDADEAMRDWVDPCNNYLFVDGNGNIRYLNRGKVPIRSPYNAWLPVPGWTGEHEWDGYIPFDQLARIENPKNGYIVTANNRIIDADYPYYIALEYAPEYRARRIVERIKVLSKASVEDMLRVHSERVSIPASAYLPVINKIEVTIEEDKIAQKILELWDGSMDSDSVAATIYSAFRIKLHDRIMGNLFGDLSDQALVSGGRGAPRHVIQLGSHLVSHVVRGDTGLLQKGEFWEEVVKDAFIGGLQLLREMFGNDMTFWEWNRVHRTNPQHPLSSIFPKLSVYLDPPSFGIAGDGDTPQAGSYSHAEPFHVTGTSVARYVFDPSDWDNSRWIVPLGSSGHPGSPHYSDQAVSWAKVEAVHMVYTEREVDSIAVSNQLLTP